MTEGLLFLGYWETGHNALRLLYRQTVLDSQPTGLALALAMAMALAPALVLVPVMTRSQPDLRRAKILRTASFRDR